MENDPRWLAPSPKATNTNEHQFKIRYSFPFDEVPVNLSFAVARNEVKNIAVLRSIATRAGAKYNRRFKVIDHGEAGYEVFCVGERNVSSV